MSSSLREGRVEPVEARKARDEGLVACLDADGSDALRLRRLTLGRNRSRVRVRCHLRELGKGSRTRHRELREALAIDRIAGGLEAGDELTVGQPVLACGSVDADDPEPPEVTLLVAPSDERVFQR